MKNDDTPHIGESFDSFLRDEGLYDVVTATAIKRALVISIEQEMKAQKISKSAGFSWIRWSRPLLPSARPCLSA